jgi:hypothetical protein
MQIQVPVDRLQTAYASWQKAPLGSLITSASAIATPSKTGYDRTNVSFQAIRARTASQQVLIMVEPQHRLLFAPKQGENSFSRPSVVTGPAIEIGATHELVVLDLAPINSSHTFVAGDVLQDANSEEIFLSVEYPDYAGMGLVLRGDEKWTVKRMPGEGLYKLGSLGISARPFARHAAITSEI